MGGFFEPVTPAKPSTSHDLDRGDVDISDILLAIAKQVSKSLEEAKLRLSLNLVPMGIVYQNLMYQSTLLKA